jgi:serine/threonine-protein kinase
MTQSEQRKTQSYVQDHVGTILADRYRIVSKLGEGGMGTVYLAEHMTIQKKVAVKVLAPEYSHRPDLVERFLQEARAASRIAQENVVEITDYGETSGGGAFIVMELLKGEDLATILRRCGPLPWSRVRGLVIQLARALAAAHEVGIVHRDMKPENCFVVPRESNPDFIKVLDFGIAKVIHEERETDTQEEDAEGTDPDAARLQELPDRPRGLTRTGVIMGTPEYMSPEQASGVDIDRRADIYAVGVIMYELLTGRVPFSGRSFMAILQAHMFESVRPLSSALPYGDVPPDAEAVVLKALQKDREFRFQTMVELIAAVEAVGTGAPPVRVIDERPTLPSQGAMRYSGTGTGPNESAFREAPTLFEDTQVPGAPRQRKLIAGTIAALALAATGVGLWAIDDPADVSPAPALEAPATPTVVTVPTPVLIPPADGKVALEVRATPMARILDARTGTVYGMTDGAPIAFDRGDAPIPLILRAPGHADVELAFTPTKDLAVERILPELRATRPGKPDKRPGKKPEVAPPVGDATSPPPATTPDPPPSSEPAYQSPDLMNPFKKKKPTGP